MRSILNGLLIALSMYSKIPVPQAEWNERNMRYAFCFFPLVGALIGGIGYGLYYLFDFLAFPPLLVAACVTVLPVLVTGGIHLDGFCDTVDAVSSRQPRERKLEILKDSHAGAFAIIWCVVYFVAYFAAAGCILLSPVLGAIVVGCGIAADLLCIAVIFKTFGGMSGDLAGWLLQVVELVMLLAAAIGGFYLC